MVVRCSQFVLLDIFLIRQSSASSRILIRSGKGPPIVFGSQFACSGNQKSCSSALMVDALEKKVIVAFVTESFFYRFRFLDRSTPRRGNK